MSSAARALGRAAICARTLRAASDDALFRDARDQLATALLSEALRVLVMNGLPAQAREDLAQSVTVTVLGRIVEGAVEPGFEDGYLAVAAKNRARDWHREKSGVYEKTDAFEDELLAAPDLDPYAALEHAEEEENKRALAERVVNVLRTAPPRYRDVLEAVYLEGVPIDMLVDQEMRRDAREAVLLLEPEDYKEALAATPPNMRAWWGERARLDAGLREIELERVLGDLGPVTRSLV